MPFGELLVYGTSRLVMNTNRCARLAAMRLRSLVPARPVEPPP